MIKELKATLEEVYSSAVAYIKEKLNASETHTANFVENANVIPVIYDNADEDAIYSCDRVYLSHKGEPVVEYSNNWHSDWDFAKHIPLDALLGIVEEFENNPNLCNETDEPEDEE